MAGAEMDGVFDLLVVGGGINGAGIARDAAGRGQRVLLVEKNDLASATSAASSKLIHGGLRYLEQYEFRLVREALGEREVLLKIAPHIVWPMRFVLPHDSGLRPAWMIRAGLFLYDHLASRATLPGSVSLDLTRAPEGRPLKDAYVRGFAYSDCWVEDSRLVVLNARDAVERGARVRTRCRFVQARQETGPDGPLWQATIDGGAGPETVRAKVLVNAAGPWVDDVLRTGLGRNGADNLRLVKGSHVVVRKLYDGPQAYILQNPDRRIVFVIPYERDFTLVGTTDVPFTEDPAGVAISDDEIAYILASANRFLKTAVTPDDVVWSYAGVRPLYDDRTNNPSAITRDYVFDIAAAPGQAPVLSIFGGKITTYRRLAEHAMEKLEPHLPGLGPAWTGRAALPGGDLPNADFEAWLKGFQDRHPWLPAALARRLGRAYGSRAERIVAGAGALADLGEDLGAGLTEREVAYLVDQEWAVEARDILWRRSKLGLHGGPALADRLSAYLEARIAAPSADRSAAEPAARAAG